MPVCPRDRRIEAGLVHRIGLRPHPVFYQPSDFRRHHRHAAHCIRNASEERFAAGHDSVRGVGELRTSTNRNRPLNETAPQAMPVGRCTRSGNCNPPVLICLAREGEGSNLVGSAQVWRGKAIALAIRWRPQGTWRFIGGPVKANGTMRHFPRSGLSPETFHSHTRFLRHDLILATSTRRAGLEARWGRSRTCWKYAPCRRYLPPRHFSTIKPTTATGSC